MKHCWNRWLSKPFIAVSIVLMACDVPPVGVEDDAHAISSSVPEFSAERGAPYKAAGTIHNEALDHVYKAFVAEKGKVGRLSKSDIVRVMRAACLEFVTLRRLPANSCQHAEPYVRQGMASNAERAAEPTLLLAEDTVDITQLLIYLGQIEAAAGTSLAQYQQDVAAIEAAADAVLGFEDMEVVYTVASIATSSAEYWEAEVPAWHEIINDGCDPQIDPECEELESADLVLDGVFSDGLDEFGAAGWRILGADVGTAIGAGVFGRLAKAFSWQVTAGAAAGASVGRAALELLELLD